MSAQKANALVHALYGKVVTDVIEKSREDFLGEGLDASVLQELQTRWERKLAQCGAAPAPPQAPTSEETGGGAGGSATAAPETVPGPGVAGQGAPSARIEPLALLGRPLPFLPSAGWITETPASDTPSGSLVEPSAQAADTSRKRKAADAPGAEQLRSAPAQTSGAGFLPTGAAAATTAPPVSAPAPPATQERSDGDEDSADDEKDPDTKNLVLSQFDKVTHAKNKWKCLLKSGVMSLDGKDFVFNTATGDFACVVKHV